MFGPRVAIDGSPCETKFLVCSECDAKFEPFPSLLEICADCEKFRSITYYYCGNCNYTICIECHSRRIRRKKTLKEASLRKTSSNLISWKIGTQTKLIICSLTVSLVIYMALPIFRPSSSHTSLSEKLKKLKASYPLQKNETWHHALSVLNMQYPTVKTITLLHDEDSKTADCLVRELISLFSRNEIVRVEDVTFNGEKGNEEDYGEVLEYYRPVVKKYKILVTDLSKVSGNLARIFHTLCDEVSSDIKPSLFIFTLRCDDRTKTLKPLHRATAILREAWSDLAENEIHPLLSRIVRNVIDVIPENEAPCILH